MQTENLVKLQKSVVVVPSPSGNNEASPPDQQSFSIDAQLLWNILIYDRAVQPDAGIDRSMFGRTLISPAAPHEDEDGSRAVTAEFDLVGSAGISGHKAVPKEIPFRAPNDDAPTPTATRGGNGSGDLLMPDMGLSVEDIYFEGVGGLGDQENLFLQANDYGRAIDNWLNFDSM